jgi:hypothetical protein
MKDYMQLKDRNVQLSFGNQQISKFQLFTDDWVHQSIFKKEDKMYKKYRENKEKEREFQKRLKTLSVIPLSDRFKLSYFSDAKISKVLKMQQMF